MTTIKPTEGDVQSLSLSDHSDGSPPKGHGSLINHNRFDTQLLLGVPQQLSGGVPQTFERAGPASQPPQLTVLEGEDSLQRHVFAPTRAPPPKRAREMRQPQREVHSYGGDQGPAMDSTMQGDLFHECAGFIQQLGKLPSTLQCCGYSLQERHLQEVRLFHKTCCK